MILLAVVPFVLSIVAQSNIPADLPSISKAQEHLVRNAIQEGASFKSEKEFWDAKIEPRAKTKRNMIQATKEIYSLVDLDRVAYAAAYAKARNRVLSEAEAQRMLIDSVQIVVKVTAWGAQGIANEMKRLKGTTILVSSSNEALPAKEHSQWIGSIADGLPIYQYSVVSGERGTFVAWNNIGQSFAHGTIFLSCLILEK